MQKFYIILIILYKLKSNWNWLYDKFILRFDTKRLTFIYRYVPKRFALKIVRIKNLYLEQSRNKIFQIRVT